MVVLYTPFTLKSISGLLNDVDVLDDSTGQASLEFFLPEEWTLISPWGSETAEMPIAYMRSTYFGIGQMSATTVQVGDSRLLLGVYAGLDEEQRDRILQDVPQLFEAMGELTRISPRSATPYWALTILPREPIHGGASGIGSLVTLDEISTISHEMFHWWNGDIVKTTPDAGWIQEGFTKYYEGKILYEAGIWSADEFHEHLDKLYERKGLGFVGPDGEWRPIDLVQASQDLGGGHEQEDYDKVYGGGALIAYFLDQELQKQGISLDEIWHRLNKVEELITTGIFLQELEKLGGAELAKACEGMVYGRRAIPRP
jgi:hypothetical protein